MTPRSDAPPPRRTPLSRPSGLLVLPLLLGLAAGPAVSPTPGPAADVPAANIQKSILDLRLTIVPLQGETTTSGRTTITISSDVLFEFDKAALSKDAAGHIAKVAARLRTASGNVQVDGYTDSVGANAYNLTLSRRRALAVKGELDRILRGTPRTVAAGHGEADPVQPNAKNGKDNPFGRAKNRRVTISFQGGG